MRKATVLSLFVLVCGSLAAQPPTPIRWEQLADHLTQPLDDEMLSQFVTCEPSLPAKPTRILMQHIAFVNYDWTEYELDEGTCIHMQAPVEKFLTPEEAAVLTTASQGHWDTEHLRNLNPQIYGKYTPRAKIERKPYASEWVLDKWFDPGEDLDKYIDPVTGEVLDEEGQKE